MTARSGTSKSISRLGESALIGARSPGVLPAELRRIHQAFSARVDPEHVAVFGVDFSSAPRKAKPIVVASGRLNARQQRVELLGLESLESLTAFEAWLATMGAGIAGFDLPFGLPRELVHSFGWPEQYAPCIQAYCAHSRETLRLMFKSFCDARPAGSKFAHRQTDRPAGSSPSMKWVNPPVAWMLHAGVPRLLAAGMTLPGQADGGADRLALEAYPGLLARSVSGASYKSDNKSKQTAARQQVREQMVEMMARGKTQPGLPISLSATQRSALIEDASGDSLDAVLCLVQAAWGVCRPEHDLGLMPGFDPLEGWIVGAGVA